MTAVCWVGGGGGGMVVVGVQHGKGFSKLEKAVPVCNICQTIRLLSMAVFESCSPTGCLRSAIEMEIQM